MVIKKPKNLPLILLTLLAALLQFFQLTDNPPSLNWDEVSHAYNAYSLLKTTKDEWGTTFPLIFKAFGDFKLPLYIYLTTIPVAIFGLNAFSARFISALAGALAIPGIYLVINEIYPKSKITFKILKKKLQVSISLLTAFFFTLNPWHYFISRPALEANLALTLFIYALFFLLSSTKKPKHLIISSILFSLTLHTYNTYRILTPIFLFLYFPIFRPKIDKKSFLVSISIFLVFASIVVTQTLNGTGLARYEKLAILSPSNIHQIELARQSSTYPPLITRLIHNRPIFFAKTFIGNYLNYFTPTFLNQTSAQRQFAIPNQNLLGTPLTLLAIIGLMTAIITITTKQSQLILLLLLVSPIAAALTLDPPQALRPTPLLIPLTSLSVLGLYSLRNTKTLLKILIITTVILAFTNYLSIYWNDYRLKNSDAWQYGYQQTMDFVKQHQSEYDTVFITKAFGEPHIYYAFYNRLPPQELQPNNNNIRFFQSDWYWTDKINSIYFVNDWEIPDSQEVHTLKLESGSEISTTDSLLVTTPDSLPSNTNILSTILDLQNNPVIVIAKFK